MPPVDVLLDVRSAEEYAGGHLRGAARALLRACGFERVADLGSLEQAAAANPFAAGRL